jgi:RNA polymerase sigma-70 factor (ECF subfamily)
MRSVLTEYEGPLIRYAMTIIGDIERARDAVQDTFLRLCRQRRSKVEDHLPQWLFAVCRNRALDIRRKESRLRPLDDGQMSACASADPPPSTVAATNEATGHALRLLARLPVNQQEVVRLKFQNGLSYREISVVTRLSESNVGFLLHTALSTLREQMKAMEGPCHEN